MSRFANGVRAVLLAGAAVVLSTSIAAPALADSDDWQRQEWREQQWQQHEWREHEEQEERQQEWREDHPYGVVPGYGYVQRYDYAPPPVFYAPPPPVAIAPGPAYLNFGMMFR